MMVLTSGFYDLNLGGDDRFYGYSDGVDDGTNPHGSLSRDDFGHGTVQHLNSYGSVNRPSLRVAGAEGQLANFDAVYIEEPAGGFTEFLPNDDVNYTNDGDDVWTWQNEPHLNTFEPAGAEFLVAVYPVLP